MSFHISFLRLKKTSNNWFRYYSLLHILDDILKNFISLTIVSCTSINNNNSKTIQKN